MTADPRKAMKPYRRELFCVPNPRRLKSKLKLVLSGLTLRFKRSVTVQQSQGERNFVAVLTPMNLLLMTS